MLPDPERNLTDSSFHGYVTARFPVHAIPVATAITEQISLDSCFAWATSGQAVP